MTDWKLNRRFAAGAILIAPAIASLLLITDSLSLASASPPPPIGDAPSKTAEVMADALPNPIFTRRLASSVRGTTSSPARLPYDHRATSISPLQRSPQQGSERWYYHRFATKIKQDELAFRSELAEILAGSGPLAERVAGLQAWHDAKAEPALEPFDQVLRNSKAGEPLRAFVLRLLKRDGPDSRN